MGTESNSVGTVKLQCSSSAFVATAPKALQVRQTPRDVAHGSKMTWSSKHQEDDKVQRFNDLTASWLPPRSSASLRVIQLLADNDRHKVRHSRADTGRNDSHGSAKHVENICVCLTANLGATDGLDIRLPRQKVLTEHGRRIAAAPKVKRQVNGCDASPAGNIPSFTPYIISPVFWLMRLGAARHVPTTAASRSHSATHGQAIAAYLALIPSALTSSMVLLF
jgi:hypothetical protein